MQMYVNYLTLSLIILPLLISGIIRIGINFINNKFTTVISIIYSIVIFTIALYFVFNIFFNQLDSIDNIWFIWFKIGNLKLHFGYFLDKLSSIMLILITSLSLIIQIYSIFFMQNDNNYSKYFCYIAFFNFSMILLVIANNFLQLFIGWQLTGISSYLLINFWFEHQASNVAALKAFIINRLADLGLLLAIILMFICFQSFDYKHIFQEIAVNSQNNLQNIKLIIGLLVIAALTKSAQFPLQVWLPDAMAGPLPISTLMHSCIMVTAGVFLLLRGSLILQCSNYWLNIVLFVGTISAILSSFLALTEKNVTRIMAYSTISQLGLMFVAIGTSISYVTATFHLATHAFFKGLLFLSIGSIYYAIDDKRHNEHANIFNLPLNLKKHLPITYYCVIIGGLSLIGFPGFSGFFSKSLIFNILQQSQLPFSNMAYYLLLLTNFITSLYTCRLFFMIFHKKQNNKSILFNNNNYKCNSKHNLFVINVCLIILAVISIMLGCCLIVPILNNIMHFSKFGQTLNLLLNWSINKAELCALNGILLGFIFYIYKPSLLEWFINKIKNNFLFCSNLLEQQFFLNKLNNLILYKIIYYAKLLFTFIEELFFNNYINYRTTKVVTCISKCIQYVHNNNLSNYMFIMLSGSLIILLWLILTTF